MNTSAWIDRILFQHKMTNLEHKDNRYVSENEVYDPDRLAKTVLCLKSVNYHIYRTELLLKTYPDLFFIALTRNGYSLADGLTRRGMSIGEAGKLYQDLADEMERLSKRLKNFKLIKFEDVLENPFAISEELFQFCEIEPVTLDKLRLKSKKIIHASGEHETKYGSENRKYWFDRDTISTILDKSVNQRQLNRLSDKDIKVFNKLASNALQYFQYDTI